MKFELVEIVTKDKLVHQGICYVPKKPKKKAILWVHGLSGTFYGNVTLHDTFAGMCEQQGWGYAVFNNRGHDLIAGIHKMDGIPPKGYSYSMAGAGAETFEESVLDLDAAITFLCRRGFTEIILAGHSTGANKTCYYAATQPDDRVAGVVLVGPMSDRLDPSIDLTKNLKGMKKRIQEGKGDELLFGYHFFPMTPKRFVSLFGTGSLEDTFDYGDTRPKMKSFSRIHIPLLVVFAGRDEYADRPIEDICRVFDAHAQSKQYKSIVIADTLHNFNGKEKECVSAIVNWVRSL